VPEEINTRQRPAPESDLLVTAVYTAYAWIWGDMPYARLFYHPLSRILFWAVNFFLGMYRLARLLSFRPVPSLRHSLVLRHLLIDSALRETGVLQVMELASGFSMRSARFTEDPKMSYTEVDLPQVMDLKRKALSQSPEGRSLLGRKNLRLEGSDIFSFEWIDWVDRQKPLVVIAEGLLSYFKEAEQIALWVRIGDVLRQGRGGWFVFDYVPFGEQPKSGWFGRWSSSLMKKVTGGKGFEVDDRTRREVLSQLTAAGFDEVTALDPVELSGPRSLPFRRVKTQQLVFVCRASGPENPSGCA